MLMALGPFRFRVPTYSVEEIGRRVGARVEEQAVIGGRPVTLDAEEADSILARFGGSAVASEQAHDRQDADR